MANENESELRQKTGDQTVIPAENFTAPTDDIKPGDGTLPKDTESPGPTDGVEKGGEQIIDDEAEEQELREALGLSPECSLTPLAKTALLRFDPDESEPQLCEHFKYTSNEFEKFGYL